MPLNDVPQQGQNLLQTRDLIRNNFNTISTAFDIDHVPYTNAGQGKHNQITFPLHTGAIAFLANEIGLFNQNAAPTTRPDIWLKRGTATAYPMTGYDVTVNTSVNTVGWTYLPSGLKLIWGRNTITAGGTRTIVFSSNPQGGISTFPGFTFWVGNVTVTRFATNATVTNTVFVHQISLSQMEVNSTAGGNNVEFYWSALGL